MNTTPERPSEKRKGIRAVYKKTLKDPLLLQKGGGTMSEKGCAERGEKEKKDYGKH